MGCSKSKNSILPINLEFVKINNDNDAIFLFLNYNFCILEYNIKNIMPKLVKDNYKLKINNIKLFDIIIINTIMTAYYNIKNILSSNFVKNSKNKNYLIFTNQFNIFVKLNEHFFNTDSDGV